MNECCWEVPRAARVKLLSFPPCGVCDPLSRPRRVESESPLLHHPHLIEWVSAMAAEMVTA